MSKPKHLKSLAFGLMLLAALPVRAADDGSNVKTMSAGQFAAVVGGLMLISPNSPLYSSDRDEPRNAAPSIIDEPQEVRPRIDGSVALDPNSLVALQEVRKSEPVVGSRQNDPNDKLQDAAAVREEKDLALKIRHDAMKESAISYGARGGLAWRTRAILAELKMNAPAMDKAYDFRRLLIKAPSNMFIEPPIVSEALNNFLVTPDGNEAAVADTIYAISHQARIVSAPRNWRQYLEREWKEELTPPPDILLPDNPEERKAWRLWIKKGWDEGSKQADEIFQADLNRLIADFEGMVRYRVLLTQNKISAPYATMEDRGVSGNEVEVLSGSKPIKVTTEMRIGDRAIRITQPATLRPDASDETWQPPIQTAP